MGKLISGIKKHLRLCVQVGAAVLTNSNFSGFVSGHISTGTLKSVCVPGLNCYSCPGAVGACPIGSLQATVGGKNAFPFYVVGILVLIGAFLGRFVCGWLCPFGLIQELLNKIPFVKKLRKLPGDRVLKYLKYVLLVLFVIILPMFALDAFGQSAPWFCKYICPAGTLEAGIPLALLVPPIAKALSFIFAWKTVILAVIVFLSIVVYRPFCRYVCPLGAIYGFFNPVSLIKIKVDADKCVSCGACQRACKLDIPTYKTPNSMECIRCGECIKACPVGALHVKKRAGKEARV